MEHGQVANRVSGGLRGTAVMAGHIHGGVHLHPAAQPWPAPWQLVAVPAVFTDRRESLAALDAALADLPEVAASWHSASQDQHRNLGNSRDVERLHDRLLALLHR
ncbi:hypothetical protein P3T27_005945 [Kitasatospora sp. MAA19]|uniref:hypothetical protein n=1 Tax=unclassified Kitasatospora TaxID=2633591 RepID=UPI0024737A31|nr:hypothetical protein [Kitasatospora sp. MAA19]MDH6709199.1 hypothetical protein [Kitasatospora sp. MAA19]